MSSTNPNNEDHLNRSNFVRQLIQQQGNSHSISAGTIPKRIVQFWDNLDKLPEDVKECISTWESTEKFGIERLLFDKEGASYFIEQKLGLRHKKAFDQCYHPAMQSDYFRLCYIFVEGGCYVDVDDVYNGDNIQYFFDDGRLKIQPLCYDVKTHCMIPPKTFTKMGANDEGWIFYFNNNPLISCSGHPILEHALAQATLSLENRTSHEFPEIQSTTGPGNLTKSIFDLIRANAEIKETLLVLSEWEDIAMSKWDLSYRNDSRNWRLSNCQSFNVKH